VCVWRGAEDDLPDVEVRQRRAELLAQSLGDHLLDPDHVARDQDGLLCRPRPPRASRARTVATRGSRTETEILFSYWPTRLTGLGGVMSATAQPAWSGRSAAAAGGAAAGATTGAAAGASAPPRTGRRAGARGRASPGTCGGTGHGIVRKVKQGAAWDPPGWTRRSRIFAKRALGRVGQRTAARATLRLRTADRGSTSRSAPRRPRSRRPPRSRPHPARPRARAGPDRPRPSRPSGPCRDPRGARPAFTALFMGTRRRPSAGQSKTWR